MKRTVFKIVISLFLVLFTIQAKAQQNFIITLKIPPPGKLNASDIWNVTVINNSGSDQSGYLSGTAKEDKDGMIAKGTTVPIMFKKGVNNIKIKDLPKTPDVEYTAPDPRYKEALERTGKFLPGTYEICVKVFSAATNEELGSDCITQEVFESGLLSLINPSEEQNLDSKSPVLFTWSSGGKVPKGGFTLRICEIMNEQSPATAMKSNRAHFEKIGIKSTTLPYPNSAKKFEEGKKYAWMVKSTDTESEVWTFSMMSSTCSDIGIDSLFITCDDDSNNVYDYRIKLTNHCPNNSVDLMGVFVTTFGYGVGTVTLPPTLPTVTGLYITANSNFSLTITSGTSVWITGTINAMSMSGSNFEFFIWSQSPTFGKAYDFKDTSLTSCNGNCCDGLFGSIFVGDIRISPTQANTSSYFVTTRPIIKITADVVSCYSTPYGSGCSPVSQPVYCIISSATMTNYSSLIPYSGEGVFYNTPGMLLNSTMPLNMNIKFSPTNAPCRDNLNFCIRYTLTDTSCRSCDTVICYSAPREVALNDIEDKVNYTTGLSGDWNFPFLLSNENSISSSNSTAGSRNNSNVGNPSQQKLFNVGDCPDIDPVITTNFIKNPNDSLCPIKESTNGSQSFATCLSACENSNVTYTTPPDPNSTFAWTLTGPGQIIGPANGNSITVYWQAIGSGTVTVVQTTSTNCTESDEVCIEIIERPVAAFTPSSVNICEGQTIFFTNNSVNTLDQYWTFGDGGSSTEFNSSHTYNTQGTYTVTLFVTNFCGCRDSLPVLINVNPGNGPDIICPATVCANTKGCYSTSASCTAYNWSVTGGTITSGALTQSICVQWGDGSTGNGVITLDVSGCSPPFSCTSPTVAVVPIIPTNPVPSGDGIVCGNQVSTYSLPELDGTYYTWSVTNGMIVSGQFTNEIIVNWNASGTGSVSVTINNILYGCGGTDSITVVIKPELKINGREDACAGIAYPYSSNGNCDWTVVGGIISGSTNNVQTVSVTWNSTGPYQIIATPTPATALSFCNSIPLTINVNVTVVLAPTTITGPTAVCTGNNYSYLATQPPPLGLGVIWSISPSTAGTIIGSANANPVTVKWTSGGILSVSQISNNSLSCISPAITLNVNPVTIDPITCNSGVDCGNVCVDGVFDYYAGTTPHPDIDYQWSVNPPQLGSIISGQGTNHITIRWNGSTSTANSPVISLNVCGTTLTFNVTINSFVPPITLTTSSCITTLNTSTFVTYQWFDGTASIGGNSDNVQITHSGTYLLKVTDVNGCTGENTIVAVVPLEPVVNIVTPDFTQYCQGVPVHTILSAVVVPYVPCSYEWFFNSGSTAVGTGSSYSVTSPSQLGNYTVTATDLSSGCTSSSSIVLTLIDPCPGPTCDPGSFTASIIAGSSSLCNSIHFSLGPHTNFDPSYLWNFGDGQTGSGDPVTHTYNEAGYYHVTICSGNPSCPKCTTQVVTVPLAADFDAQINCNQLIVTDKTTFMPGVSGTLIWSVQPPLGSSYSPFTGPLTLVPPGTYNIKLVVTDNATGCTSQIIKPYTYNTPAVPTFTYNPSPVCTGVPVNFTGPSGMFSYRWEFGDGSTSFDQSPQHVYTVVGTGSYNVSLTVVDNNGCSSDASNPITVIAAPASPPAFTDNICANQLPYTLTAPSGSNYQWFKDNVQIIGGTSPTLIIYANTINPNGNYTVQVTAGNGCPYMTLPTTLIVNPLPKAIITPSMNTSICIDANAPPSNIIFSAYNGGGYTYLWEVFSGNDPTPISNSTANTFQSFFNPGTSNTFTVRLTVTDPATNCVNRTDVPVNFYTNPMMPLIKPRNPNQNIVCEGTPVILDVDLPITNGVYLWSTGETGTSITVSSAGIYTVTLFDANGCSATSGPYTIHPKPDMSLFPTCGDTLCDTTNLPGPKGPLSELYAYQWYFNDLNNPIPAPDGTEQELDIPLQTGDYYLQITSLFGCVSTAGPYSVTAKNCDSTYDTTSVPSCCTNTNQIKLSSLDYIIDDKHELNISFTSSPVPIKKVIITILGSKLLNSNCGINGEVSSYFYGIGNITGPVTGLSGPVIPASYLFSKEVIWGSNSSGAVDLSAVSSAKLLLKIPMFLECEDDLLLDVKYTFVDSSCTICDTVLTYRKHRKGKFTPWDRLNDGFKINETNPINVGLNDVRSRLKSSDIGKDIEEWYTALSATNWVEKFIEKDNNVEMGKSMLKIGKRLIVDGGKLQKDDIGIIEKTLRTIQELGIKAPDNLIDKVVRRLEKCVGMSWKEVIDTSLMLKPGKNDNEKKKNDMKEKNDNKKNK